LPPQKGRQYAAAGGKIQRLMPRRRAHLLPVAAAFFLSGAAALVYQVAWQRILALQTGVGLYSIAVIVAAFMVGLGVGSHLGAVASTRVTPRRALVLFAACELGIAAFGSVSVHLYYDWMYLRWGWLFAEPVRAGVLQLASLALPTVLMGMSLPFLTRAMVRDADSAGRTIGLLYGVNVFGASVGALATPWVFIRHYGIPAAVTAAAIANLVAGLGALALALRVSDAGDEPSPPAPDHTPSGTEAGRGFRTWLALYALSGLCALALEIVWFRVMDMAVKSTAYTFGTVLSLYLLGSAAGALLGTLFVRRVVRPLRAFLLLQCLLLAYAGAVIALLPRIPVTAPGFRWYFEMWGKTMPFVLVHAEHWEAVVGLYVVLPFLVFGPPTVLMGLSFPILQRAVQDDPATSGWKVGVLQAANIAGCVAGSLVVGLWSLTILGTPGTVRALLLVGVVFAVLGLRAQGMRTVFAPLAAVLVLLAIAIPGRRELWMRLHGTTKTGTILAEDATGISALIPGGGTYRLWHVWSGGLSHSWLPFGWIHTSLGAAPALIHPAPRRVAIVGLGSGDTASSAGCRRDVDQRITVFEVHRPQRALLGELMNSPEPPGRLARFLSDPRYTFRIADGRNALDLDGETYDLIEADALWPTSPYAGNLYSLEFFQLVARRLNPGGMATTWAATDRVRATFQAAFPYVIELARGEILIGSASPIPIDPEEWQRRLNTSAMAAYLGPPRVARVWQDMSDARPARPISAPSLNHDLFPRDEFLSPD
jgi:spermidine synthase